MYNLNYAMNFNTVKKTELYKLKYKACYYNMEQLKLMVWTVAASAVEIALLNNITHAPTTAQCALQNTKQKHLPLF